MFRTRSVPMLRSTNSYVTCTFPYLLLLEIKPFNLLLSTDNNNSISTPSVPAPPTGGLFLRQNALHSPQDGAKQKAKLCRAFLRICLLQRAPHIHTYMHA